MATDLDMGLDGHTPGPWVPCETDSEHTTLISGNDGSGATRNGGIYIARVQGPDNRANARVIAAAPELLAKLNEVLDFYDALPSEHAPGEVELLDSITALIAKAKAPSRA